MTAAQSQSEPRTRGAGEGDGELPDDAEGVSALHDVEVLARLTTDLPAALDGAVIERILDVLRDAGRLDDESAVTADGGTGPLPAQRRRPLGAELTVVPDEVVHPPSRSSPPQRSPADTAPVDVLDSAMIPVGGARTMNVVSTTRAVVCRVATRLVAFLDQCPRCEGTWEGVTLSRRLGSEGVETVLRCPRCRAHYDVRRDGVCLEDEGFSLTPLDMPTIRA